MAKKPDLISDKDFDKIKEEVGKKIRGLKPRKPQVQTDKRVKAMSNKKATEQPLTDVKGMLKDQIEYNFLQKAYKDSEEMIKDMKKGNKDDKIFDKITGNDKKKSKTKKESTLSKISPKDFKGLTDEEFARWERARLLEEKPEYAHLFKESKKKESDIDDVLKLAEFLKDKPEKSNYMDQLKEARLLKILEGGSRSDDKDSKFLKYIIDSQKDQQKYQMKMLEKIYEEKELLWKEKLSELEAKVDQHPLAWLFEKKEEFGALREFFCGITPADTRGQLELKQEEHKYDIERMKTEHELEETRTEKNKGSEFLGLVKEGLKDFTSTISQAVGAAVGKVGKEQLGMMGATPMIPIEQIEQNLNPLPLPVQNPEPVQQPFQMPQFNFPNINYDTPPPVPPPPAPIPVQQEKKHKGFQVLEGKR